MAMGGMQCCCTDPADVAMGDRLMWAAEAAWPGGLGFSRHSVKSGGPESDTEALARGEEVER
jgi:hypothetical protein